MRRFTILLLLLALVAITPLSAQEGQATEEPTAEATQGADDVATDEAGDQADAAATEEVAATEEAAGQQVQTVPVRFAHFAPDAPVLVTYVDGQPSGVQDISYPAMSGWVEIPVGSAVSLIPQGGAQSQAVVGPFAVSSTDGWLTIVVVGSQAGGTIRGFAIRENITTLPEGCALVTVFNAVEGGQAFDLAGDDGTTFGSNIGFPSGQAGAGGQQQSQTGQGSAMDQCAQGMNTGQGGAGTDAAATEEAAGQDGDTAATQEADAGNQDQTGQSGTMAGGMGGSLGAADCIALPAAMNMGGQQQGQSGDTAATEEANAGGTDAAATEEANAGDQQGQTGQDGSEMMQAEPIGGGETFANCASTFLVPAGTFNLSANAAGGDSAIIGLQNTEFAANTYYFLAIIGTQEAPQAFTFSTTLNTLQGVINNQQGGTGMEAVATQEAGDEGGDGTATEEAGDQGGDDANATEEADDQGGDDANATEEAGS